MENFVSGMDEKFNVLIASFAAVNSMLDKLEQNQQKLPSAVRAIASVTRDTEALEEFELPLGTPKVVPVLENRMVFFGAQW